MKVIIYLVLNWMRYLTRTLKKLNNAPIGALITIIGMDSCFLSQPSVLSDIFAEVDLFVRKNSQRPMKFVGR